MIKSISSFMQKSKEQEYNFSMINGNEPISIKGVQTVFLGWVSGARWSRLLKCRQEYQLNKSRLWSTTRNDIIAETPTYQILGSPTMIALLSYPVHTLSQIPSLHPMPILQNKCRNNVTRRSKRSRTFIEAVKMEFNWKLSSGKMNLGEKHLRN